jgi:hypothetical protein
VGWKSKQNQGTHTSQSMLLCRCPTQPGENTCPQENLHTNIDRVIHNSQKVESAQVSTSDEWKNRSQPSIVEHRCSGRGCRMPQVQGKLHPRLRTFLQEHLLRRPLQLVGLWLGVTKHLAWLWSSPPGALSHVSSRR